jgi:aflatoxin B1 aldehyde reductase
MRAPPRLYLGTMTFGWSSQTSSPVDESVAAEMVRTFAATLQERRPSSERHRIDTARIYAGGQTEPIVAQALQQQRQLEPKSFVVGTKAHPSLPGGLSPTGIVAQFEASQNAMPDVSVFGEYYLHQPDPDHALLDSLKCLHDYHEQGLISAIGMSNFHSSEMERAFSLCAEHHLTPPTVYQGLYNPLNRLVETELLPVLRKNHCSFVAYNPLAGGLLTGKYSSKAETIPQGRFRDNPNYLPRFFTPANLDAVSLIQEACLEANITLVQATYRWLLYHSALTAEDGILLGASSVAQLQENLDAACPQDETPLPDTVLVAFDAAWRRTQGEGVFPYWRSYSADMPDRAQRDPGASYDATKKSSQ